MAATPVITDGGAPESRPNAIQPMPQTMASVIAGFPGPVRISTSPMPSAATRTRTAASWAMPGAGRIPVVISQAVTLAQVATLTQPT